MTPAVSAPTWPGDARQDVDPGARMGPDAQLRGGQLDRRVRGEGERRGAERRRVDAEQEVVHDRVADDRELEDLGALDAGLVAERGEQAVERLADRRGQLDLAALDASSRSETRLMRSSPKRICGFMTPALARIEPSARFARWPAIVVEPTSMATPNARSWKPGQTAMTSWPPWTATVTR